MATRKQYTKEFKLDAVRLVAEQGYTCAEAARNLGLNANMLGRWVQEYREDGPPERGHILNCEFAIQDSLGHPELYHRHEGAGCSITEPGMRAFISKRSLMPVAGFDRNLAAERESQLCAVGGLAVDLESKGDATAVIGESGYGY